MTNYTSYGDLPDTMSADRLLIRLHGRPAYTVAEDMAAAREVGYNPADYSRRIKAAVELGYLLLDSTDCYRLTEKGVTLVETRQEEDACEYHEPPTCPICDAYGCGDASTGAPCRQFEDRSRY